VLEGVGGHNELGGTEINGMGLCRPHFYRKGARRSWRSFKDLNREGVWYMIGSFMIISVSDCFGIG
jgi:hypothetical protein